MAPLLGLAAGLVVEMGGTLSHGAIIAREYGLPALANVRGVTRLLKNGELIIVNASRGEIRRLDGSGESTSRIATAST
jgi:pyruvate,water dikinase